MASVMRLPNTGSLGLMVVIALGCACAGTGKSNGGTSTPSGGAEDAVAGTDSGGTDGAGADSGGTHGAGADSGGTHGAGADSGGTNTGGTNSGGTNTGGATAQGGTTASGGTSAGGDSGISTCATQTLLAGTWVKTNWPASNSFFRLYARQDTTIARTWDSLNGGRVYLTADGGANWAQIGSADSGTDALSIVLLNNDLLAGTWDGLYTSTSRGASWNAVTPTGLPADTTIWSLSMIDVTLFAGTKGGIYKSSDNGNTWTEVGSGIPASATITSIIAGGNAVFAGSDSDGVLVTTDAGTSWTAINSGLADTHISQLASLDTRLFAVTLNGVFVSDDHGTSWATDSSGLENINCLLVANHQLLAGTDDSGVHLSTDSGATWTSFSSGMPESTRVWSLAASSDTIFAGTDSGVWRVSCSE